jgi:hypothetical protein
MNPSPTLSPSPAAPVPVRSPRTSILLAELARQRRLERSQRRLKRRQRPRLSPSGGLAGALGRWIQAAGRASSPGRWPRPHGLSTLWGQPVWQARGFEDPIG